MSLRGTKQSRTVQFRPVLREITSCLPITSFKKGSHPALVSVPHRTGNPHDVYLARGVLKQVQHDGGVKGDCHFPLQRPPDFKPQHDRAEKMACNLIPPSHSAGFHNSR
jgi:hypothetical protein